MSRHARTIITAASVVAALTAVAHAWVLAPPDLPFPAAHLVRREVFPQSTLDHVEIGSPIASVYELFSKRPPPIWVLPVLTCVRFRYDPDIAGGPVALVFAVRSGLVEQKWLLEDDATPPECEDLRMENVDLTRYYDAAWCCPWPG